MSSAKATRVPCRRHITRRRDVLNWTGMDLVSIENTFGVKMFVGVPEWKPQQLIAFAMALLDISGRKLTEASLAKPKA